jgi:hypothetical protein
MRRAFNRVSTGILDQGVSSLSNVIASLAVARSVTPKAFGAFALAYSVYLLVLGVSRGLSGETYMLIAGGKLRQANKSDADPYEGVNRRGMICSAGAIGVLVGLLLVLLGSQLSGPLFTSFIVVGVSLPVLLLQDAARFCAIAEGRPSLALLSDTLWTVVVIVGAGVIDILKIGSLSTLAGLWACAGAFAAVMLLWRLKVLPALGLVLPWFRSTTHIGLRLGTEYLISMGVRQVGLTAVGLSIGLSAVGAIRGGQAILGPVTTFQYALLIILMPEIGKYRGNPSTQQRVAISATALLVAAEVLFGLILWLLPSSFGRALLGSTWPAVHLIIVPQIAIVLAVGSLLGGEILLRGNARVDKALRLRVISGLGTLAGTAVGCVVGNLQLALWLQAAAPALMLVFYWRAGRAASEDVSVSLAAAESCDPCGAR